MLRYISKVGEEGSLLLPSHILKMIGLKEKAKAVVEVKGETIVVRPAVKVFDEGKEYLMDEVKLRELRDVGELIAEEATGDWGE